MTQVVDQLPSSRQFVASLISSLNKPAAAVANPLTDTAACKEHLLTLHVLFQNELLPALDLLDRGLVTRLRLELPPAEQNDSKGQSFRAARNDLPELDVANTSTSTADEVPAARSASTYYVRSAQQQQQSSRNTSSRFRNATYEQTTYYELLPSQLSQQHSLKPLNRIANQLLW
ncbi:hypothetical protein LTR97_003872 [Elasticomyces elasticus]|uniref:Uncharacterized protein n=1 Tax=Elasticomyces elasticus TaxID=574655 RepID=A0AAN7W9L4_9PEZI|nr:hypothetical protein LTR42_000212 [Elasticomyces elasticus]KAK5702926.1 hypothetical protein LTR97_003872 [Elasticomyces elasticus]